MDSSRVPADAPAPAPMSQPITHHTGPHVIHHTINPASTPNAAPAHCDSSFPLFPSTFVERISTFLWLQTGSGFGGSCIRSVPQDVNSTEDTANMAIVLFIWRKGKVGVFYEPDDEVGNGVRKVSGIFIIEFYLGQSIIIVADPNCSNMSPSRYDFAIPIFDGFRHRV